MSKILLNSTPENSTIIDFGYSEDFVQEINEKHFILSCLYNPLDEEHIDYSKLKENFSLLLGACNAFDAKTHTFHFNKTLNDFQLVSILQAIDIGLNNKYNFSLNVKDKEKAKTIIMNYKKLTTEDSSKELFLKMQNEHKLKESSYALSKILFNYTPDYTGKKLLIIDTHNKYHRDYNAMPHLTNSQGQETMVIKSFLKMISGVEKNKPDYIILATEGKNNLRKVIDKEYKANRKKTEDNLISQINEIEKLCEKLGIKVIGVEQYEADDVITSYTIQFKKFGGNVQIVSTDKDLYQLLSDNVSIYNPVTKKIIKPDYCIEKFGVKPNEMRLFLSLTGDSADNIPGVKGIGDGTAAKYINKFGNSIDDIIAGIDTLKDGSAAKRNLENGIEDLKKSYVMVELYTYLANEEYDFERFRFPEKLNWANIEEEIKWFEIVL